MGPFVPGHVARSLNHVITIPSRDRDEGDVIGLEMRTVREERMYIVTNTLKELGDGVLDLVVTLLGVHDRLGVHLVDGNDHLLDTKSEGKESVLTGLTVGINTSLELTLPEATTRIATSA